MVKKRIFGIFILPILLLSSCNKQRPLRSDIANFIASFSLQEAMNIYKETGYEDVQIMTVDGEYEKTIEKLDFNIKDEENITFTHSQIIYDEENNITSSKLETIRKVGEEYIHTLDDKGDVYTINQCASLIKTFFYKSEPIEGYHDNAIYFGDYIQSAARYLQDHVTIDLDNELYIYEYHVKNANADNYEKYSVDKYGMLTDFYLNMNNLKTGNKGERTISVYNNL